jgi:hypothetical protein
MLPDKRISNDVLCTSVAGEDADEIKRMARFQRMKEKKEVEAQARAVDKERAKSSKRGRIGLEPPKPTPPAPAPPPLPADLDDDSMDRRDRRGPPSTNRNRSKSNDQGIVQGLGSPPGPQGNNAYDSGGYLIAHMQEQDQRRPVAQNMSTGDDITEGE